MTNKELKELLDTSGVTFFYNHAPVGTLVPFGTYETSSDNFAADNKVYYEGRNFTAVLYTVEKDETREALIENVLNAHDIPWDKETIFIESERFYQTIYTGSV